VIAELIPLADRPRPESAPTPPAEEPSLTLASVTSSLQLILAARRAARFSKKDVPEHQVASA
jgi:hypothetical protein